MKIDTGKLYDELLGPTEEDWDQNQERVSDRLIDMVIQQCDVIAEMVNSCDSDEQLKWLMENGCTPDSIREFVGRTSG